MTLTFDAIMQVIHVGATHHQDQASHLC